MANLNLNKTTCTYIIYVGLEAPKSLELEVIRSKRCLTKLLRVYNRVSSSSSSGSHSGSRSHSRSHSSSSSSMFV